MAQGSGLAAQVGYGAETTAGTAVTPTRFLPLVSESLDEQRERLKSDGIIAGRRFTTSDQWNGGNITVSGDVQHELYTRGTALLWKACLGANATTGSGPYTHTATVGDLSDDPLTVQVGRPDISGTVRPFTYAGCFVDSWEVACQSGEIATFGVSLLGMSATTGTALATASYAAGAAKPFKFNHGVVSIAATSTPVKGATISGNNGLAGDRRVLGSQTILAPLEQSKREITAAFEIEFPSLTHYAAYVSGAEVAFSLTFTAGADSCTITGNAFYNGAAVAVGGPEILSQNLELEVVASGTDAQAFSVVTVNGDSTA